LHPAGGTNISRPFSKVLEKKAVPQELDIVETVEKMIKE